MKCVSCGFESEQDFAFCTQCGAASHSNEVMPTPEVSNPLLSKTLAALKSPLFLTVCILVTASAAIGLFNDGLPLLHILASVFLWIVFAKSRKDNVHTDGLRNISGVIFADYIVSYVVTGIIFLVGLLLMAVVGIAAGSSVMFDEIVNELGLMHAEYIDLVEIVLSTSGPLLFLVCALLAAAVFLFNFFGTRKIHRFVQSLYQSLQNGTDAVQSVKETKTWLIVLGIFSAISNDFALANIVLGAAMIVASVLVGKYFTAE